MNKSSKRRNKSSTEHNKTNTKIVCIGASAGGLEALEKFFRNVSVEENAIYVLVQHLSPDYKSVMSDLLNRYTDLTNKVVEDGDIPESGSIYLIPPSKDMELRDGAFRLHERNPGEPHLPINLFLESLASEAGPNSIAIILSGTGTDGSNGITKVAEAGGVVMVQSCETARFDGMPRSAIATGIADFIGTPEEIAKVLFYSKAQLIKANRDRQREAKAVIEPDVDPQVRIFKMISDAFGLDLDCYKEATIFRRIQRRVDLRGMRDLHSYAQELENNPQELDQLYRDLLIEVTSFFRDPEVFEFLEKNIISQIVEKLDESQELRAWACCCATGEEAYSIAMLLNEALQKHKKKINVRIFATDIHQDSLRIAGIGQYGKDKLNNISPEYVDKYFTKTADGYTVKPNIRRMITFAPHNILCDPPFKHIQLISCRNMLIYLNKDAQKRVLLQFLSSLEKDGILLLGSSESLIDTADQFSAVNTQLRFFQKVAEPPATALSSLFVNSRKHIKVAAKKQQSSQNIESIYQPLLEQCMPSGFLVNHNLELLHTFGDASKYLSITGPLQPDLANLLKGNLRVAVTTAIERCRRQEAKVTYSSVSVLLPGDKQSLADISVHPIKTSDKAINQKRGFYFISIAEVDAHPSIIAENFDLDEAVKNQIETLERDLAESRENLQTTVEELETSNEELQATNEELLAANEELQSTNEELQSVNEELHSVNAEFQEKNFQLTELNNDVQNLISCTEIGIIFLDSTLHIRRFTPAVTRTFFIRQQDIGRPLTEIKSLISSENNISKALEQAIGKGAVDEREVTTIDGSTFLQRILPYMVNQTMIKGAVVTYVDITRIKESELTRRRADLLRCAVINSLDANIAVLDHQGNILEINDHWRRFASENDAQNTHSLEVGANYFDACRCSQNSNEYDDAQTAISGIKAVINKEKEAFEMEYRCNAPDKTRWFLMKVTPLRHETGGAVTTHLEITERKEAEIQLAQNEQVLKSWLDGIDALVLVTEIDNYKIIFTNEYGRKMFGDVEGVECWKAIQKGIDGPCEFCSSEPILDESGKPAGVRKWTAQNTINGRWYDCRDQAVEWSDGHFVRLEIATDITDRVNLENDLKSHQANLEKLVEERSEKLIESEHKFRSLFENATIGFAIHKIQKQSDNAPPDFVFVDVNPAFVIHTGLSPEEVLNRPISQVIPGIENSELFSNYAQVSATGYSSSFEHHEKSLNRFYNISAYKIDDDHFVSAFQDITDWRMAEESLRHGQADLKEAQRIAGLGKWEVDLISNEIIWSDATYKILQKDSRSFIPTSDSFFAMVHPDDREKLNFALGKSIKHGLSSELEYRLVLDDGTIKTVLQTWRVQVNEQGQPVRIIGIMFDVTRIKKNEEELRQAKENLESLNKELHTQTLLANAMAIKADSANKAKSEFLANMSHEIRTPLNSVLGFTELLLNSNLTNEQLQYVKNANTSADILLHIINDILDFSKIEAGKLELEEIETDIFKLAAQTIDTFSIAAAEKEIELILDTQPDAPRIISIDPLRTRQILMNLLGNAIKFTSKGTVELRLRFVADAGNGSKGTFTFSVHDTGIGISKEQQESLFKPFSQADTSTARVFGGTGLGLTISRSLAAKMGGQLIVESEPDQGSAFYFSVHKQYKQGQQLANPAGIKAISAVTVSHSPRSAGLIQTYLAHLNISTQNIETADQLYELLKSNTDINLVIINQDNHEEIIAYLDRVRELAGKSMRQIKTLAFLGLKSNPALLDQHYKDIVCLSKPIKIGDFYDSITQLFDQNKATRSSAAREIVETQSFAELNPTILVADDVNINLVLITTMLNELMPNATIIEATNGQEAIETVKTTTPDLILMDLQMPEVDGYSATKAIRELQQKNQEHTPILALTAGVLSQEREKCFEVGMDDFLSKPVRLSSLREALEKHLLQPCAKQKHFDRQSLLENLGNREGVCKELITLFPTQISKYMTELELAIEQNNQQLIRKHAHRIKGAALNLCCEFLADIAVKIEKAEPFDKANINQLFVELKQELTLVFKEMTES